MCCCGKPTINGQPGYSWDGKSFRTRAVDPPELSDGDELLYDGPGRCGGIDSHCHHFRLVRRNASFDLLVRHGGGDERIRIGGSRKQTVNTILALPDNDVYWLLQLIYSTASHEADKAVRNADFRWSSAFVEGRLKKRRRAGRVTVEVIQNNQS